MPDELPEEVILRRALLQGILKPSDLEESLKPLSFENIRPIPTRFGPRIERLIHRQRISSLDIERLIREVQRERTATTLDGIPERVKSQPSASKQSPDIAATDAVSESSAQSQGEPDPATSETLPGGAFEAMQPKTQEFPVRSWSRYEFLSLLGQGGMGSVYKARDKRLGRIVALKFVHSSVPQMTMRFVQEARAQARINHAGICKVYEVGEVEGKAFIAMQFVDGQTLDKLAPQLTLHDKVLLVRTVSEAIHAAHRLGIIHRDIKPSMISVRRGTMVAVPPFCRSGLRKCC